MANNMLPTARGWIGIAFCSLAHFAVLAGLVMAFESNLLDEEASLPMLYFLVSPGYQIQKFFGAESDDVRALLFCGNSLLWGVVLYALLAEAFRSIKRRRVSIRYLLAIITLLAVLLGLAMWAQQHRPF